MNYNEEYQTGCKNAQRVASKFGYVIVCDEDEVHEAKKIADDCANAQEVASKYGYTVICEEID